MPMGHGALGTEITDDDFDDGDEDISSHRLPPSGVITPSESSIRSSEANGALIATTVKRRVVRISDTSYATYRAMLYFLYIGLVTDSPTRLQMDAHGLPTTSRLYSFTPLTPPKRQASRDLKDNTSDAGSDVLSDFDPAELTFTQSQHDFTLSNLNTLTSSGPLVLSTGPIVSPTPPNASTLGASVQRRNSIPRTQRGDSGSVTAHVLHHRESSPQLHSQFTSSSTRPINSQANSTVPSNFNLSQSVNL